MVSERRNQFKKINQKIYTIWYFFSAYPFRRNDRIIRFFENFENFLGEEQMWEISETIKPRGKRAIVNN